jgi:hypothetical protein
MAMIAIAHFVAPRYSRWHAIMSWDALPGQVGRLGYPPDIQAKYERVGGGTIVYLCRTESDWDALLEAKHDAAIGGEGSGHGLLKLFLAERVAEVPVGTKVRVIKMGSFWSWSHTRKVLVLEGRYMWLEGWIGKDNLLPPR